MLSHSYRAIIIGAGPGGLAVAKSLLDVGLNKICWIDRNFGGGRLNELYREISSNTKTGIYLDAVNSSKTCREIINSTPKPNAITKMEKINRDETCQLSLAGDLIKMIEGGILREKGVEKVLGEVEEARLEGSTWKVGLSGSQTPLTTSTLFLCTGSQPIIPDFHRPYNPNLEVLDLDRCMIKSSLPSLFPKNKKSVVGVIGNSHSGILVCRNLFEVQQEGKRDLKILNFHRSGIRYAIYPEDEGGDKDGGGIIYDNTGLKGDTAKWSKEIMENPTRETQEVIEQINLNKDKNGGKSEEEIYKERLKECTHLIYSIGYKPNPYPQIYVDEKKVNQEELKFDQKTTEFSLGDGRKIKGLFGLGIAHPEKTKDPLGNVENNVGMAKFFKFADEQKDLWKRSAQE